jgi:hypothetical protein
MANNIVSLSAYQINQHVVPLSQVTQVGMPVASTTIGDSSTSPNCLLSTGKSVYSFGVTPDGNKYYFQKTYAELAALMNA